MKRYGGLIVTTWAVALTTLALSVPSSRAASIQPGGGSGGGPAPTQTCTQYSQQFATEMITAGGVTPIPGATGWYWGIVVWQNGGPVNGTYYTEYERLVAACQALYPQANAVITSDVGPNPPGATAYCTGNPQIGAVGGNALCATID
jgi:hypothetical protein